MGKKKWEFSFDLDTRKTERFYTSKYISGAYRDIGNYLVKVGFDSKVNKQGSCYFTSRPCDLKDAQSSIINMFNDLPWLAFCINKCNLSEYREIIYDFNELIDDLKSSPEHRKEYEDFVIKKMNKNNQRGKSL